MPFVPHPELHPVFEAVAYAGGYGAYKFARGQAGDFLSDERRWLTIAAAAVGALVGARVLGLLEQAPRMGLQWRMLLQPGAKTIVGGLLGGWIAVELLKLVLKIRSRTGDLYAIPLCLGIGIGRIGCYVAGLADDTYGMATTLPWGVDFGDGIRRHPTQLYELCFLMVLAGILWWLGRRPHRDGALFRVFMGSHLAWRLLIDFIKPQPHVGGLNMIQWACVLGLMAIGAGARASVLTKPEATDAEV